MPRTKKMTEKEEQKAQRLDRLARFKRGKFVSPMAVAAVPKSKGLLPEPRMDNWGVRAIQKPLTWSPLTERIRLATRIKDKAATQEQRDKTGGFYLKDVGSSDLPKVFAKVAAKIQNEQDYMNSYWGWIGIIQPEYELLEPWTIFDTEAYLRVATERKQSLMFRNGFKVMGDNETFRQYIEKRFAQIAYFMDLTTENFFKRILIQLLVSSNCIVLKIRDENASGGTANDKNKNKKPVAAYTIVPSHTIYPYLDGKGRIEKWRRFFADGRTFEDYPVEDIIHFYWDKKEGHIFGTPRTVAIRDDILALRRLEENVELLMIHHLFPLFHVAVGTPDQPADYEVEGVSEVDFVRNAIEQMPKEGMLVTDERVRVEAVGAKTTALEYDKIVQHYKTRVFTGLGVSGVDMGEGDTSNRSTAETVSQNLKDSVKADLDWFCGQIQMLMIKEFFQEAPFDLSVQNAVADVHLAFSEIDVDGMIKTENHHLNLYNSHLIDETEARQRLGRQPLTEEQRKNTHYHRHILDLALRTAKARAQYAYEYAIPRGEGTPGGKSTGGGGKGSPAKKATPRYKSPKVAEQPENQHGRNLDPHRARSSTSLESLRDLLLALRAALDKEGRLTLDEWRNNAEKAIYLYFSDLMGENAYTNQERMEQVRDRALALIRETHNPDLISVILDDAEVDLLQEETETHGEQETDARPAIEPAQGAITAGDSEPGQSLGDESTTTEGTSSGVGTGAETNDS
jgi:hypothetical protein